MLYSSLLTCVGVLATFASAQSDNFTECCNVAPTTVKEDTRTSWCLAQTNTCPLLCAGGETAKNDCDDVSSEPDANRCHYLSGDLVG